MKHEKNSEDRRGKNDKQPEDCPPDSQRNRLLHSISGNLGGDRMLRDEPMGDLFLKRSNWYKQKIVDLLPVVPLATLSDFREFSRFIKTSLIRIEYQCYSTLYHFLCVAAEIRDSETDPVLHADFLVDTLFKEINSMNDAIAISATILDVNKYFELELADTFSDEESPHECRN
ncbi:MAG: hypothetical protein ACT6FC_06775 [Methanosarcinaceae archaeon]